MREATQTLTASENKKLAVLMRMALTYAGATGAEPDAFSVPIFSTYA